MWYNRFIIMNLPSLSGHRRRVMAGSARADKRECHLAISTGREIVLRFVLELLGMLKELLKERGNLCEICHKRQATEAHHCLYRRDIHTPILNQKENLQLVCRRCHSDGSADSWENRTSFWNVQVKRYGLEHMIEWHKRVPYKVKEKYERYTDI
jgi:hypothetical protein